MGTFENIKFLRLVRIFDVGFSPNGFGNAPNLLCMEMRLSAFGTTTDQLWSNISLIHEKFSILLINLLINSCINS